MISGIGVGIGFSATPPRWRQLVTILASHTGELAQAIYVDGLIAANGDSEVQQWNSAIAANPLVNARANPFTAGYDEAGGFRYIHGDGTNGAQLTASLTSSRTMEVWIVCRPSVLPFSNYRGAVQTTLSGASATRFFTGSSGASTWYATVDGTCHRDNVSTNVAASGWHVYKRYRETAAAHDVVSVGNDAGTLADRSWAGDIAFVMLLNGQTDSTQQDAMFSELIAYHKVTP